jgi:hypothetical protein
LVAQRNTDHRRVNMKWWTMRCISNRALVSFSIWSNGKTVLGKERVRWLSFAILQPGLCKRFHIGRWWSTMRWTALYSELLRCDHRIRSVLLKYLANKRKISAIFTELCMKVQQGWSRIWGTEMTSSVKLRIFHSTLAGLSGDILEWR